MIRLRFFRITLALTALLSVFAIPVHAETMGISGGHDLDGLWSRARSHFDLSSHDAVLLLESRNVTLLANGNIRTKVHRVVWIGKEVGIDEHADLRIPFNSATSTMNVTVLRTWRDDRWWPESGVSETAVVETLPFALSRADDYTTMRETMLLHDGVELPCVMETAYVIEERGGAANGADGHWVLPQRDPAVLVEFILSIPEGNALVFRSANGAPEPEMTIDADGNLSHEWRMENVAALGAPRPVHPESYAPYVSWSTWKGWKALGTQIMAGFDEAAVLSDVLADTLAKRLANEPSPASKARKIAAFIDECTRNIRYDTRFWAWSPRPASRTWETAYGHSLDRAVLAAALFRKAGLKAEPVYRSIGLRTIDLGVPGLSGFEDVAVWVEGDGLQAIYHPTTGTLSGGSRSRHDRILWKPGTEGAPPMGQTVGEASRFELILTLEPAQNEGWNGTGYFSADGGFCPHDEMVGLNGEALAYVGNLAASVLQGAEVSGFNPEVFEPTRVTAGFEMKVKAGESDVRGRTRMNIGDPAGGIMAQLPPDVRLYHERRGSPIVLPGMMTQRVQLRIKTGERKIVYLPEPFGFENEAGRYTLNVEMEDGWVTIDRELTVGATDILPEAWPGLRALLLEETDAAGRTILMKTAE